MNNNNSNSYNNNHQPPPIVKSSQTLIKYYLFTIYVHMYMCVYIFKERFIFSESPFLKFTNLFNETERKKEEALNSLSRRQIILKAVTICLQSVSA